MLSKRLFPALAVAPVNVTRILASATPSSPEKAAKDRMPVLRNESRIVPVVEPATKEPILNQLLPPSALYSQSWEVKPVVVRWAVRDMERSDLPVIEKAKTALFPLALRFGAVPAPPRTAKAAGDVVTEDSSVPSEAVLLMLVPVKAFNSVFVVPVAGTNQLEDPFVPSK